MWTPDYGTVRYHVKSCARDSARTKAPNLHLERNSQPVGTYSQANQSILVSANQL